MHKRTYIFFIILFFSTSVGITNYKGYFNIRAFLVDKRVDVQNYMNLKHVDNSFVLTTDSAIKNTLITKFNDIEDIEVKKNLDFTVNLKIKNKSYFGKISDGIYLDDGGKIFYSNLKVDNEMPLIVIKDFDQSKVYLTSTQINFIRKLVDYPKFTVYLLSPFGFDVVSDKYSLEVPYDFSKLEDMSDFANSEIKNSKNNFKKLVVLKDKIVFKN